MAPSVQRTIQSDELSSDEREDYRDFSRGQHGQPVFHDVSQPSGQQTAKEREGKRQLNMAKKLAAGSQVLGAIGSLTGNQALSNLGKLGTTAGSGTKGFAEGGGIGMARQVAAQGAYYGVPYAVNKWSKTAGLSKAKAGAAGGAVRAAIQGKGSLEVAEGAASGALSVKKFEQYKLLFQVLKGVKIGAAATIVGIIITILIWIFQLFMAKVLGRSEWDLSWWEKIFAYPVCFIIFVFLVAEAAYLYQVLKPVIWLIKTVV